MSTTDAIASETGLREGTFGLGRFARGEREFAGLVTPAGDVLDLTQQFGDGAALYDDWPKNFDLLQELARTGSPVATIDDLRPLPPVARPNLLCSGANYVTHVAQMMTKNSAYQHLRIEGESDEDFFQRNYERVAARRESGTPFVWTGLHSSLIGANDDIVLPVLGEQPDWELELAVIVGKARRHMTLEEATRAIAGYTVINDLGTIDIFRRTDLQFEYDWISKQQPTFKVLGPYVVPAAFFPDLADLRIRLDVNGQTMQDWPVDDFIFTPAHVLAYLSERVNLMPGDVVAMGSPPGNGAHHGRFLQDGDVVDSSITGLGRQRNHCRDEDAEGRVPVFGLWTNRSA